MPSLFHCPAFANHYNAAVPVNKTKPDTAADAAARTRKIRRSLLAWFADNARDMPWRRTRDPYAIWVSEVMLQQTQVDTVIPYYHRFLATFPTIERLAAADLDTLLKIWEGLGYYTRARNLHKAAKAVVENHGGQIPDSFDALLSLPGVGRYTAAAVASIAFGLAARRPRRQCHPRPVAPRLHQRRPVKAKNPRQALGPRRGTSGSE